MCQFCSLHLASAQVKDEHVFSCCVVVVSVPLPVTGARRRGSVGYVGKVDPFTVGHLRPPRPCLGQVSDSNARYDNMCSPRTPCITHSWNYSIRHYCASPLCSLYAAEVTSTFSLPGFVGCHASQGNATRFIGPVTFVSPISSPPSQYVHSWLIF